MIQVTRCRPLLASLAVALFAACGGTAGGSQAAPKAALLLAARQSVTHSLRVDGTLAESLVASGPKAATFASLNGQTFTATFHLDVQNQQRVDATVTTAAGGRSIEVLATLYDGSIYVSTDAGKTYRSVASPSSAVMTRYSPQQVLQFVNAVGTVTDQGHGTVDGVSVERYHAQLDGSKVTSAMKSALSSVVSPYFQKVASAIRFTGGSLDATIDHQGRLVTESGVFDVSIDLGAIQSSFKGTDLSMHATFDAHFHDYGARISVTPPVAVSGTTSLS